MPEMPISNSLKAVGPIRNQGCRSRPEPKREFCFGPSMLLISSANFVIFSRFCSRGGVCAGQNAAVALARHFGLCLLMHAGIIRRPLRNA